MPVKLIEALSDVSPDAWNGLGSERDHPFTRWEFLEALETSGCVGGRTGWWPRHLVATGDGGALIGAMPGYLKTHSQGEYVFDHGWANAFERAGGRYYPKWINAIPFTPVTGPRIFSADPESRSVLLRAAMDLPSSLGVSSAHILFAPDALLEMAGSMGWLHRQDIQYHWQNDGYGSFDDFLAALSSRKRKDLRKERERAQEGLTFRWLTGPDLTEGDLDAFFAFYQDTGSRKWGLPYLNRTFFSLIAERMPEVMALVLAYDDDKPIAGALNFIGADTLYGRYWGRTENRPFLHFETCYYQAIDFALSRGLSRVEAGAQGEHKLARGYAPCLTHSLHAIAHDGLREAVADFLERERGAIESEQVAMKEVLPFRKA